MSHGGNYETPPQTYFNLTPNYTTAPPTYNAKPDPINKCKGVNCPQDYVCKDGKCILDPTIPAITVFDRTIPTALDTYKDVITGAMTKWEEYIRTPTWVTENKYGKKYAITITEGEVYDDSNSSVIASVQPKSYRSRTATKGEGKFAAIDQWKLRINKYQWDRFTADDHSWLMVHELGHCLGLASSVWLTTSLRQFLGLSVPVDQYLEGNEYEEVLEQYNSQTGQAKSKTPLAESDSLNSHWNMTVRDGHFGYSDEVMIPGANPGNAPDVISQQLLEFYKLFGWVIKKNGDTPTVVKTRTTEPLGICGCDLEPHKKLLSL